jgi:hypothetical protein
MYEDSGRTIPADHQLDVFYLYDFEVGQQTWLSQPGEFVLGYGASWDTMLADENGTVLDLGEKFSAVAGRPVPQGGQAEEIQIEDTVLSPFPLALGFAGWPEHRAPSQFVLYAGYDQPTDPIRKWIERGEPPVDDQAKLEKFHLRSVKIGRNTVLVPYDLFGIGLLECLAHIGSTSQIDTGQTSVTVDTATLPPRHRHSFLRSLRHAVTHTHSPTGRKELLKRTNLRVSLTLNLELQFQRPFPKRGDTLETFLRYRDVPQEESVVSDGSSQEESDPVQTVAPDQFALAVVLLRGRTYPEEFYKMTADVVDTLLELQRNAREDSEAAMKGLVHQLVANSETQWARGSSQEQPFSPA